MAETQDSLHFLDYWRVIRARKEIVIAVFLLVVVTGVFVTFAMPKVYMAAAKIQVKEEVPDLPIFSPEYRGFDPLFLRTQFEIIQSAPVIEEVIRKLELHKTLGRVYGYDNLDPDKAIERTRKILSRSIRVQQFRDTNLIEIQVYLSEPKGQAPLQAALAANMFAQVFREQSLSRSRRVSEGALRALEQQLQECRDAVEEAFQKAENIRRDKKIDRMSSAAHSDSSFGKLELMRLTDALIKARMDMEDRKARFEKVMSLATNETELLASVQYVIGDQALQALVMARREAEVSLNNLLSSPLGPRHPDVVRGHAVVDELKAKVNDALKGLKIGVQHDYETARGKCDALDKMMDKAKASERMAEGSGYAEFDKAVEELERTKRIRDALELKFREQKIEQNVPRTAVEVIEYAKAPDDDEPVRPDLVLNTILSILIGLVTGVGLAYFVEYVDTSIKTVEDVERYMKLPVLAVIPQKVRAFADKTAETLHAEAYRMLRTNVQFSDKFKGGRTLCITSGSVAEGKSLTVFNLAYVCAEMGDRVLIVDADLHRPRQHKILGLSNRIGLANYLAGEAPLEQAILTTPIPNLSLLVSGRAGGSVHGLLDTRRVRELVATVKERFDIILFDAPPMLGVSDTSLLVREVDGVLQIIQHRKYPRSVSIRAKDMIENLGGNLLGVVLNNINIARDYSYYYHYHYYYPRRDKAHKAGDGELAGTTPSARTGAAAAREE